MFWMEWILLPSVGKIQLHQSYQFHAPEFRLPVFHSGLMASGTLNSLMWLHLHFAAKQQATRCFRSLKPIQTGLFMLMCSNIHLLSLLTPNLVRHDTCWHKCALESGLTVDFFGQLHHRNWPYYPAVWIWSPSSVMVSAEPFSDTSRHVPCNSSQMGPCQITDMRLWPAADYEPYCGRVSIDKVRRRTTTTSQSWRWCSQAVAGVYTDYSIREMNEWKMDPLPLVYYKHWSLEHEHDYIVTNAFSVIIIIIHLFAINKQSEFNTE